MFVYHAGKYLDLQDFDASALDMGQVADNLSAIVRYAGSFPISVARHSLVMFDVARCRGWSLGAQHACLLHDAAEALYGDLHGGLKAVALKESPTFAKIISDIDSSIFKRFSIDDEDVSRVVDLDKEALLWEVQWCLSNRHKGDLKYWGRGRKVRDLTRGELYIVRQILNRDPDPGGDASVWLTIHHGLCKMRKVSR